MARKNLVEKDSNSYRDLLQLERKSIALDKLLLDPRNPRFPEPANISETRYKEEGIQERAMEELRKIGIDDLLASIRTYGFVPTDPIVVRPLNDKNHFLVLEGNRRVASLKNLLKAHKGGTANLDAHVLRSISDPAVLVYSGGDSNIAWVLQGLRHMTGIKEWQPLQQAEFLARIESELSRKKKAGAEVPAVPTIARRAGVPPAKAGRLLNAYWALQQAREDEDYGASPDINDMFGIFSEGVFKKTSLYQDWLGWNQEKRRFEKTDNLKKLMSWTLPQDPGGEIRISRAVDVRDILSDLVLNPNLLSKFENGSIDINQARVDLMTTQPKMAPNLELLLEQLNESRTFVDGLPLPAIRRENKASSFAEALKNLRESIDDQLSSLTRG